jgi:hypothetical protein
MPGLIGYMVAIVVTLGGYLIGLHWLVSPPDPWRSGAKITQLVQTAKKRTTPVIAHAEPAPMAAAAAPAEMKPASAEIATRPHVDEPVRPIKTAALEVNRASLEPARVKSRDMSVRNARPANRRLVSMHSSRKLQLMVLRTYQRSDGTRFTRLLPWTGVRSALAFAPSADW